MGNVKAGNIEIPIGSLLIFVGAIVAVVSLFLGYINMETINIIGNTTESINGLDIITGGEEGTEGLSFVHWAPLIIVIASVLGLIMALIPIFAKLSVDAKVYNIILAVVLVVAVVFGIIFVVMGAGEGLFTGTSAEIIKGMLDAGLIKISLGVGAYLGLIGPIVALVGAGLNIKSSL